MSKNGRCSMSLISNIGILQNSQDKKTFSKISFEVGQKFNAKIVSINNQKGEVNLKLIDGWQFSAKMDKSLKQYEDGTFLRFEVEGFEEDKLKVKLIYEDKEGKTSQSDILVHLNKRKLIEVENTDALLFEKMVKHDMSLTKDNITDIKNLVDFKEKIFLSVDKEDIFIAKYLNSRGFDINSEKGKEIAVILKDFFQALKNLSIDEILLFKENNIELNKGNLESFLKLFQGESAIYRNLKDINNYSLNNDRTSTENNINASTIRHSEDSLIDLELKNFQGRGGIQGEIFESSELGDNNKELDSNIQMMDKVKGLDNAINSTNLKEVNTKVNGYGKTDLLNEIISMIKNELNAPDTEKKIVNEIKNKIEKITTDFLIKEQIKLKTEEIKNIVKDVIENKLNLKPEAYEKVMNEFSQRINDIKMFNSLSEQYYYLDLPINVKEDEYQLKLIIKDDRKKGKKIDSKNVKIATRVKTVNMGTVEAFIKINNSNMNINIKCDKFWVKALDIGKEKLIKDLSTLNYRVNVEVNDKTGEFTLSSCREFFDDRSFNAINIKV